MKLPLQSFLYAVLLFLAACSTDPNQQKLKYLASGDRYFQNGQYQEAVIQYRNALQIDSRLARAHYQLGRAYLSLNAADTAYRELAEAVKLQPNYPEAQLQLAALLNAGGRHKEARAVAEKVLAADPGSARAHRLLGNEYVVARDIPHAVREFEKSIELDPAAIETSADLGALYVFTGKPAEAQAVFRKAVQANPKSVLALVALSRFYSSQHRMAEAEAALWDGAKLEPRSSLPRLRLVELYLASGRLADGERVAAELKRIAPDDPQAYRALGLLYVSTGQKEKAAAEFRSVAAAKPKDTAVKGYLIESLMDLNQLEEAARLNQQVLASNPGDARAFLASGRILVAQGKNSEAQTVLEKAVKADAKSAAGHYFLGVTQTSLGLTEMAEASFRQALKLAPGMPEAAAALADLRAKAGDFDEALRLAANIDLPLACVARAQAWLGKGDAQQGEAMLQAALQRDPAFLPALRILIDLDTRRGRLPEVTQRLSGLVEQRPGNAGLHFLLAVAYFNAKDLRKAETSVRKALELESRTPDAHMLLARIDAAGGSVEKAKLDLLAEIKANPRNIWSYLALKRLYEKEGNWEEARKICEKAHQADPTSAEVANSLAYFYLEHGGDVNVALSLAQLAKQKMPGAPYVADTLGWAYYKLGSPDPAVAQLRVAVQKAPKSPVYHYHLGMAYAAAGQPDSARQSLSRALAQNADFAGAANARATLVELAKRAH